MEEEPEDRERERETEVIIESARIGVCSWINVPRELEFNDTGGWLSR